jgi:Fe(3+) dicitrate transport protein
MARTIQRLILICLLASCQLIAYGQTVEATVVDNKKQAMIGVYVSCGKQVVQTNEQGLFKLSCSELGIYLYGESIDSVYFPLNGFVPLGDTLVITPNTKDIEEVEVMRERLHYFDIGYLPPIRGVQIATGTNTILEIERQGGAKSTGNPRELFAKVPGLNIWESDGAGIQMGVGGRGLSPNRSANFNTRQNGYDISADALGYPESYYTPPVEALHSIEIIRGSASLQYGTQFGGLMNFVLRDPPTNTALEITTRQTVGNYGYFGSFNRIAGAKGRFEYQAYYQLKTGNGYRPNSDFTQHQAFAQLGYHLNEKHRIRLEYTHMTYLAQQPGGLTDQQFEADSRASYRSRNWFKVDWNVLALHYDWEIKKNKRFNLRAFGMLSDRYSLGYLGKINTVDPMGKRDLIAGEFKNAGVEARYLQEYEIGKKLRGGVLVGARAYTGQTQNAQGLASAGSDADFNFQNPGEPELSDYSFPSQNLAGFIENILFIGERFTLNAGFRYEYIRSEANGYYKKYAIALNQDTIGIFKISEQNRVPRTVPLAGIGGSFKTGKRSSLYTNYCMNYRAINFNDIRVANANVLIDTLIKDEYGSTTELGWRGFALPYLYIDVALFHLFYGDKIGLAPEGDKKIRTNIGDAVNYGIEFFSEFDFIRAFRDSSKIGGSVFINASYIQATYVRSREKNYVGNQVEYVSPVLIRGGLKIRSKNWQLQTQASYNSAQFSDASNAIQPSGDAVIGEIPAYLVVDLSARYSFKYGLQLELGVNNLLNNQYYTRRATAYPGPGILPSDGIMIYGTLQYKFSL